MSNKLRYSNQKQESIWSIVVKKQLHTQKLLTILIAQLNLDDLRTASTRTYRKSSKQIDIIAENVSSWWHKNQFSNTVFNNSKQFIHRLVCFYGNLFSSFLMLLHS